MVYRRRTSRRTYRRRYTRKTSTASKVNKALYLAKKAQSQKELKWHQVTTGASNVNVDGSLVSLSSVAQGDANNMRDGNVIYPTSVKLRLTLDKSSADAVTRMRIIIFRWISETPEQIIDVLDSVSLTAFKSDSFRYQSQILYDKVHTLSEGQVPEKFVTVSCKLRGLIAFADGAAVPNRNGIWMIFLSDSAVATSATLRYTSRLYFKDA